MPVDDGDRGQVTTRDADAEGPHRIPESRAVPLEGLDLESTLGIDAAHVELTTLHVGPLPPPDQLRAYNQVVPGAGRDVIDAYMAQVRSNAGAVDAAAGFDKAKSEALRSVSQAEAFAMRTGAVVGVLGVVVVAGGVVLGAVGGSVSVALMGTIPGVIIAAGGWISAIVDRRNSQKN